MVVTGVTTVGKSSVSGASVALWEGFDASEQLDGAFHDQLALANRVRTTSSYVFP